MPASELVQNERIKLVATAFNTLATFTITAGILAPAVAAYWRISSGPPPDLTNSEIAIGMLIWFAVAVALHWLGSLVLGSLREP